MLKTTGLPPRIFELPFVFCKPFASEFLMSRPTVCNEIIRGFRRVSMRVRGHNTHSDAYLPACLPNETVTCYI